MAGVAIGSAIIGIIACIAVMILQFALGFDLQGTIMLVAMIAFFALIVWAARRAEYGPEHRHWSAMGVCGCKRCKQP